MTTSDLAEELLPGWVGQRDGGARGAMTAAASRRGSQPASPGRFGPSPWVLPLIWTPHERNQILLGGGRLHQPAEKSGSSVGLCCCRAKAQMKTEWDPFFFLSWMLEAQLFLYICSDFAVLTRGIFWILIFSDFCTNYCHNICTIIILKA